MGGLRDVWRLKTLRANNIRIKNKVFISVKTRAGSEPLFMHGVNMAMDELLELVMQPYVTGTFVISIPL